MIVDSISRETENETHHLDITVDSTLSGMAPTLYTTMHHGPMTAPAAWTVMPTSPTMLAAAPNAGPISLGGIPALAPYLAEPASPPAAVPQQTILTQVATTPSQSQGPSPSPPTQYPLSVTMCMEVVWHGEFERLFCNFQSYQHSWHLGPTSSPPPDSDGYKIFQDSAKVRFSCGDCGRGWTSMKGRVAFWFQYNHLTNQGDVLFKLYGQQCQRCQEGGQETFHHAMWYPEEVVKVIQNLYNRVGTVYYGFQLPPIRIDRRNGKPRAQHDSKLCQACKDGLCREGWTLN